MVRNAIAELASEQFEMATYKAIAKAGEIEGDTRVGEMAKKIIAQEAEMAKRLDKMLEEIVGMYYRGKKTRNYSRDLMDQKLANHFLA